MNKNIKFLPFISLLLIAMSIGDKFLSFAYCVKMGLALILLVVSAACIVLFLRNKFREQ
jgi:hypothetical protein